jgi:hypothetical protein
MTDPRITARQLAHHYGRAVDLPLPGVCGNCHQPVTYAAQYRRDHKARHRGLILEREATLTPEHQARWIIRDDGYAQLNSDAERPRHKPHACQIHKSGRAA